MINRNFTLIWTGKLISQLGDKFYAIALAWWILQKTNSPSVMGVFLFTSMFPAVVLGFFAGVLTDRWKRKYILIITDLIRGSIVLYISMLAANNALEVGYVFLAAFCLSVAAAFFDPAALAIIPEVVAKEDLSRANGLSQMAGGICTVAGPMLGAVSVSVFGIAPIFAANSISYFISAVLGCFIVISKDYRNFLEKKNLWMDIVEGVKFLREKKRIVLVLKIIALAHFFLGSLMVSLPFLAKYILGNGVRNLGILEMTLGMGMITMSLILSLKKWVHLNEKSLIIAIFLLGISFSAISAAQFVGAKFITAYILDMFLAGCCIACASVIWQGLLQRYTPDHMTGRVFSISSLVGNVSLPVSYGLFGMLLSRSSILGVAAGCGLCLLLVSTYFYMQLH